MYSGYNQTSAMSNSGDMKVGDWLITMLLVSIPVVNLIMLCIWAFGSSAIPESKRTWAKATLIMMLIAIVVMVFFVGSTVFTVFSMFL